MQGQDQGGTSAQDAAEEVALAGSLRALKINIIYTAVPLSTAARLPKHIYTK